MLVVLNLMMMMIMMMMMMMMMMIMMMMMMMIPIFEQAGLVLVPVVIVKVADEGLNDTDAC